MKPQDFLLYLEQPRLLYQLPLTKLQALALEYPYSPNLRLLLLLKTHLEGHPQETEYLNRCASAAFDRAYLYDLLRDPALRQSATEDEVETLELKTLEDIALEEAALLDPLPEQETTTNATHYADLFPTTDSEPAEEEIVAPPVEPDIATPQNAPASADTWTLNAAAFQAALPSWKDQHDAGIPTPDPVSRFSEGRPSRAASSLQDRLLGIRRLQASKLADAQEEVRNIARRSLVTQEAVASETLAQLLVRQGQYKNALKMYQRLSLLYPEKKSIFAGLIKELKEKL